MKRSQCAMVSAVLIGTVFCTGSGVMAKVTEKTAEGQPQVGNSKDRSGSIGKEKASSLVKDKTSSTVKQNTASAAKARTGSQQGTGLHAYLGVAVSSLHPSLMGQLRDLFGGEHGVQVTHVAAGSAAEKAGIRLNDILVTYNDQKLFSLDQLIKLVRSDRPGQEIKLGLVRDRKKMEVAVTLGANPSPRPKEVASSTEALWLPDWQWISSPSNEAASDWQSFDSLTLKKLDNGRFKVEIQYLDKSGKMQSHKFEGSREDIHTAIKNEKDLPKSERSHLLRALDLRDMQPMAHVMPSRHGGMTWEF